MGGERVTSPQWRRQVLTVAHRAGRRWVIRSYTLRSVSRPLLAALCLALTGIAAATLGISCPGRAMLSKLFGQDLCRHL